MGVTEPEATFSPCFGGPFLVWHPGKYAELLSEKIEQHDARVWLINTGWIGGGLRRRPADPFESHAGIINAIYAISWTTPPRGTTRSFSWRRSSSVRTCPAKCSGLAMPGRVRRTTTRRPATWRSGSSTISASTPKWFTPRS